MIKFLAPAVLAIALLAAGCGDDSEAIPFGPGADSGAEGFEDILEDLADGTVDPGDLEGLMESAQAAAESFGDSGAGTVNINNDTIEFTSEICFAGQGNFSIEGPGAASDGTPVWVSISQSVDSREDLLEFFDEASLQMIYGDADPIIDSELSVDYGRSDLFGDAADDLPSFNSGSGAGGNGLDMATDGNSASGRGDATDYNYVAGGFDTTFPFTFSAGCS
jgi:hypothetical protein